MGLRLFERELAASGTPEKAVPQFTTLQQAAGRLLWFPNADRLLTATAARVSGRRKCAASAASIAVAAFVFSCPRINSGVRLADHAEHGSTREM